MSASFKGKSRVQQHQLVYEALKGEMGGAARTRSRCRPACRSRRARLARSAVSFGGAR